MQEIFQFCAEKENVGKRLDRFLYEKIGGVSRMFLANLIKQDLCFVNDAPQPGGYHLRENDRVEISVDISVKTSMTPENLPLEIVFEDEEILIVNKPAGMLVHPTKNVKTGTLANALAFHLNFNPRTAMQNLKLMRPGLIHRLDKETSGLLVIAKTDRAMRILSSHFQRKMVKKIYLALVEGIVSENEGIIKAPIGRIENEKPHWRVAENGKESETRFRVLEKRENTTLLKLEPVTGRTNQLRIHCAYAGFPIRGDVLYGGRKFSRLCLHAAKLEFFHPNGGRLRFESSIQFQTKLSD